MTNIDSCLFSQIRPEALRSVFTFNVYIGCMQSSHLHGQNSWIITRVGFCFKCPNLPCNDPVQVDCWTTDPPTTVPWAETNNDQPCYTGRKKVCYCGFNKIADCSCWSSNWSYRNFLSNVVDKYSVVVVCEIECNVLRMRIKSAPFIVLQCS